MVSCFARDTIRIAQSVTTYGEAEKRKAEGGKQIIAMDEKAIEHVRGSSSSEKNLQSCRSPDKGRAPALAFRTVSQSALCSVVPC